MQAQLHRVFARPCVFAAALALTVALPVTIRAQEIDCDRPTDREVRRLEFVGNATFSSDELSTRVLTTPSSFTRRYFRYFGTRRCIPDPGGLELDVRQLKQFYKDNGFYEARIDTVVRDLGANRVAVTFGINEGLPLILDSLAVHGLDSVPDPQAIVRDLHLKPGARFGLALLFVDFDTLVSRLRNAGYPKADILRNFDVDSARRRAVVELNAMTGRRTRFGTIDIDRTGAAPGTEPGQSAEIDSAVVLGLLGFSSGDWYSDRALAEAQRNLYNLGTFRHVGIDTTTSTVDSLTNILVDVREDYMRQTTREEGWATLDCFRLDASYSNKNFLDKAWRLDLAGRLSKIGYAKPSNRTTRNLCYRPAMDQDSLGNAKLNYYISASARQPAIFGGHWTPAYSIYSERRSEFRAYLRTTYVGLDASATRNLGEQLPFRLGYTFELGRTQADPTILCLLFSRCGNDQTQIQARLPFGVASVAYQIIRTDNLVDPRSGYRASIEGRGSAPFLGSNQDLTFFKVTGDEAVYKPLSSRITIATRFRGGIIRGGRNQGTVSPPPQERLYAGGATSVRGFAQNELGPLVYVIDSSSTTLIRLPVDPQSGDTLVAMVSNVGAEARRVIPVGGNSLVVLNFEVRIRDPFFPDLIEYAPFIDAGQLNSEAGTNVSNLNRLYVTPGLGARIFSAVGPIQVNLGYNPSKKRAGQAYWTGARSASGAAPLICVTAPGAPVAPVRLVGGRIDEPVNPPATCPDSFVPAQGASRFFKNLVFTVSIGTAF